MLNLTTGKIIGIAGGVAGTTAIGGGTIYGMINNNKDKQTTVTTIEDQKQEITEKSKEPTTSKTVKKGLEGIGPILLGDDPNDSKIGDEKWKAFQAANKPNVLGGNGEMEKGSEKQNDSSAPKEFKDLCKSNSEKQIPNNSDALYTKVVEYCTKPN